ncbi:MAG TPA: hypothetical protein VJ783_26000 [Pirellulales bacterium]|nr:hypothetical protein [Pirellulales bacterium]
MATQTDTDTQQRAIVEHFRSTGYEGREPWIATIDPMAGSRIVAVRQFEACASHPACAWRDNVDDEIGLWGFMRDCLLENLESFARIIETVQPDDSARCRASADDSKLFDVAWNTVSKFLGRLRTADASKTSYGETAVNFLLAVMALRQIVDVEAQGGAANQRRFEPSSTNVHPSFLPDLLAKLATPPLDFDSSATLPEIIARLDAWLSRSAKGD